MLDSCPETDAYNTEKVNTQTADIISAQSQKYKQMQFSVYCYNTFMVTQLKPLSLIMKNGFICSAEMLLFKMT